LKELKESRDNEQVVSNLEGIRKAIKSEENIMPAILKAVKSYATLGEICDIMREEYGEYRETVVL